jgi:hypothetical protein
MFMRTYYEHTSPTQDEIHLATLYINFRVNINEDSYATVMGVDFLCKI